MQVKKTIQHWLPLKAEEMEGKIHYVVVWGHTVHVVNQPTVQSQCTCVHTATPVTVLKEDA